MPSYVSGRDSMLILTIFRPRRRYLIISDFIQACLDEETLLDEDGTCFGQHSDCGQTDIDTRISAVNIVTLNDLYYKSMRTFSST